MASETNLTKSLLSLPPEIHLRILTSNVLLYTDICSVSQVCRNLHDVCGCNEIWRAKFHQRWLRSYQPDTFSTPPEGWKELFKVRKKIFQQTKKLLENMVETSYHLDDVDDEAFKVFLQLGQIHEHGLKFALDDLHYFFETESHKNLTHKYYAKKALNYLHHQRLAEEWKAFFSLPAEEQRIEQGAVMVSDWMQPLKRVSLSYVIGQLDDVADRVRDTLKQKCPGHPACSKDNTFIAFKENLWSVDQCREVLEILSDILYKGLGFQANCRNYVHPDNSYIDEVLRQKKGIPISMSIVYSAVARRLGVVLEPVNFPSHFLLRWKEHPMSTGVDQYTFVDPFNNGRFRTHQNCLVEMFDIQSPVDMSIFEGASLDKVFERCARNIVHSARVFAETDNHMHLLRDGVSLYLAICPEKDHYEMRMLQIRIFAHLKINLAEVVDYLQKLPPRGEIAGLIRECKQQLRINQAPPVQPKAKLRGDFPAVKFSVGMIMKHKRYDYMCVIYGWDYECQASSEWISRMGVDRLELKHHQPFYNVLVADGSNRYAAQENLYLVHDCPEISHADVGKYFQEFTGHYYLPNAFKAREYPEDEKLTRKLVDNFFATRE